MQTVADGQGFGPITDKLVRDLLNAGARLTAQVTQHPQELGPRLHAYTVEITTALAMAVNKLESAQADPSAPQQRRRPKRPPGSGYLSLVKPDAD
jgi:hypothetical protein